MLVAKLFPDLLQTIEAELFSLGRMSEFESCEGLTIVDRCRCDSPGCATFYTKPKPRGPYGPGHKNIVIKTWPTLLVLDVVDGEIACVEVLDQPEMAARLAAAVP